MELVRKLVRATIPDKKRAKTEILNGDVAIVERHKDGKIVFNPDYKDAMCVLEEGQYEVLGDDIRDIYHFVRENDLLRGSRKREKVYRRQHLMTYLRKEFNTPLVIIGAIFGGYDHASVMHLLREYNKYGLDEDFIEAVQDLYALYPIVGEMEFVVKAVRDKNSILIKLSRDECIRFHQFRADNFLTTTDGAIKLMMKKLGI